MVISRTALNLARKNNILKWKLLPASEKKILFKGIIEEIISRSVYTELVITKKCFTIDNITYADI